MEVKASYEEGHLLVAAIRVLIHRQEGRPPTVPEIAELVKLSREWAGVLVSALERAGIVRTLAGPFETRVEILDHTKLESLPRGDSTPTVDDELKEFSKKKQKEEEKLQKLFGGDALKKHSRKMDSLADEFQQFKPRPPKTSPLFDDPGPEDD